MSTISIVMLAIVVTGALAYLFGEIIAKRR